MTKKEVLLCEIDEETGYLLGGNPIVHCKDCKYSELRGFRNTENGRFTDCIFMNVPMMEDDFCSEGVRKEDDTSK